MSEPLLNVMKVMLLCGLYLFFLRVLWSVFSELRDPRTVARKRDKRRRAAAGAARQPQGRQPQSRPANVAAPGQPPVPTVAPAQARAAAPIAPEPAAAGQLMIIDPPELAGHRFALGNEITLGRAHTNGIMLDDTYVSTVHARIFLRNGTYFVEDLASRNGSMINDRQLVSASPLTPGDRLQLGATAMEFS